MTEICIQQSYFFLRNILFMQFLTSEHMLAGFLKKTKERLVGIIGY